jgi:hypothetical protein
MMDPSFGAHSVARLRAADTLLLGRRTYGGFRPFRPSVVDSPQATEGNREPVGLTRLDVGVPGDTDNTIPRYGVRR